MAASTSDKFLDTFNSANPNVATVTATRTAAATTLQCDDLSGWPTATAVSFSTYQISTTNEVVAGTQIDWIGIVSGNNIGSLTRVAGASDSGNAIGDVVEMNPTATWASRLVNGLLVEHNQDGTHGAVTATSVATDTISEETAANGVDVDGLNIKDGFVTGGAGTGVKNTSLDTTAGELGGAWQSWTPTLSERLVDADWTKTDCDYIQIGKTVIFKLSLVASDATPTSNSGTSATFTLPVTSTAVTNAGHQIGTVRIRDASGSIVTGVINHASTTTATIQYSTVSGSLVIEGNISTTAPFTWTTNDGILGWGMYEAA